jgi:thioredoxin 1
MSGQINQLQVLTLTDATFEAEVLNSELPVVVDFWAAWCSPCHEIAPILDKLAAELKGKVKFAQIDIVSHKTWFKRFCLNYIPVLLVFKDKMLCGFEFGWKREERDGNIHIVGQDEAVLRSNIFKILEIE